MSYDFLVIGGGIAGLSAAAELSELGSVLIVEAEEETGYHASGRSAAIFAQEYGGSAQAALSQASEALMRDTEGLLAPRGQLLIAAGNDEEAFEDRLEAHMLDRITPEEACEMVPVLDPDRVVAAGFGENAWDIDCGLMLRMYLGQAQQNQAELALRARVEAIGREENAWIIETSEGEASGRVLVNAAGAWAGEIAEMAGIEAPALRAFRRSLMRLPPPGGHDVSGWPFLRDAGGRWYARPDDGTLLLSPAEASPAAPGDARPEEAALVRGLRRWGAMTTETVERPLSAWAGLRCFAPDRLPLLGPDADVPDFVWVAGQGGRGFQTAPAAARLVADLVAGRVPELDPETVAALSPARFG